MEDVKLLRVSKATACSGLAASIFSSYEEDANRKIVLRSVGAGALNQAMKAVISSNRFFSRYSLYVTVVPSFNNVEENGMKCTCIELEVKLQKHG